MPGSGYGPHADDTRRRWKRTPTPPRSGAVVMRSRGRVTCPVCDAHLPAHALITPVRMGKLHVWVCGDQDTCLTVGLESVGTPADVLQVIRDRWHRLRAVHPLGGVL